MEVNEGIPASVCQRQTDEGEWGNQEGYGECSNGWKTVLGP